MEKKGENKKKRWTKPAISKVILSLLVEKSQTPYRMSIFWKAQYRGMFSNACSFLESEDVLTSEPVKRGKTYSLREGISFRKLVSEELKRFVAKRQKQLRHIIVRDKTIKFREGPPTKSDIIATYKLLLLHHFKVFLRDVYLPLKADKNELKSFLEPTYNFIDKLGAFEIKKLKTKLYWRNFFTKICDVTLAEADLRLMPTNQTAIRTILGASKALDRAMLMHVSQRKVFHLSDSEVKESIAEDFFDEDDNQPLNQLS